jgi:hypothetical protein
MDMWSALFVTLPTRPNAVRLRVWRALKGMGCGALRDGVYVLPEEHANLFAPLVEEIRAHGGHASVMELGTQDPAGRDEVLALFDRSDAYGQWRAEAQLLHGSLHELEEGEARRRYRTVAEALQALRRIDYYPGPSADQAQAELDALRQALDEFFSRGEPAAQAAQGIARLDPRQFRGKRWATRTRPWVDRLACAWLICRFIDPDARFLWLEDPAGSTPAPRGALGFDYDGARFTHVGARVSFEVLAASFGLDTDLRLKRIASAVHFLDVGGIPVPEAAGLEAVLSGLREVHADDDRLTLAAAAVFDALYAAPGTAT